MGETEQLKQRQSQRQASQGKKSGGGGEKQGGTLERWKKWECGGVTVIENDGGDIDGGKQGEFKQRW